MMNRKLAALATVALLSTPAIADEPEQRNWSAAAEVGLNITSGNTKTESLKTRIDFKQELEDWDTSYVFDALRKKDEDETSAQKWLLSANWNYNLNEKHAFFAIKGSREEDKFSTYDNYNAVSVGYGRRLLKDKDLKLDVDAGPGYAFYEFNESGESENAFTLNASASLKWIINKNASFTQKLIVLQELKDEKNTKTRLESALVSSINGSLKMKLGLTILNNTEAPEGEKKTDTETSITLVYSF